VDEDAEVDAPMSRRPGTTRRALALALLVVLLGVLPVLPGLPSARAAPTYGSLSGNITGPSTVGQSGNASYVVDATGGPAVASNGTQVGIYSYNASVSGTNTSSVVFSPTGGSMPNGTITIGLKAGNVTQQLTLYVLVTSQGAGTNSTKTTTNLSYTVNVVTPYRFTATIVAGSGGTVSPFSLTVLLDGAPVGAIAIGSLAAGTRFPVAFSYVNTGLSAGWHTFTVSIAEEHGLVTFAGGAESISQSFYVAGPPTNDTIWYVGGLGAFVGVVFIWTTRVAASRRGRAKK
jgi:hypothetical protein